MYFTTFVVGALLSAAALAAPFTPPNAPNFKFPLENGFPIPREDQIPVLEKNAGGTLSNAPPPPTSPLAEGLTNFQLIALNEEFEVAFFTELLHNITNEVPGYTDFGSFDKEFVHESLHAVRAQEELHALNANGVLSHFTNTTIEPCTYNFPVDNFADAIALAATFTDVVLGTLQDVQSIFAQDGGPEAAAIVPVVGSVIGQEGEQNGWYRVLQGKRPSSSPFLTRGTRDFAFTAIQSFVVPGSCPNIDTIKLTTFAPLDVLTTPEDKNMTLSFSTTKPVDSNSQTITYLSGQNLPVTVPITVCQSTDSSGTMFEAEFPFEGGFSDGLTIAALTNGAGPFASADDVATATIAGPGLIEVN